MDKVTFLGLLAFAFTWLTYAYWAEFIQELIWYALAKDNSEEEVDRG